MRAGSPSLRRRVAIGLALATALAVGLSHWALLLTRADEANAAAEREAVVTLRALAQVVERAGGGGDATRRAVTRCAAGHEGLAAVRVVAFRGLSLEASTAAADAGEKAAPRRLARDEKALYDLGQRLRSAVTTNREEGGARKAEIESAPIASGGLALAAPVESEGEVSGFVAIETTPPPPAPVTSWLFALAAFLAPVILFVGLGRVIGERRTALVAIAAVVLLAATVLYGRYASSLAVADHRAAATRVAERVKGEGARAAAVLGELHLDAGGALDPASWDADRFRRPRGMITAAGAVDEGALGRGSAAIATRLRTLSVLSALLGLAVLGFVGLGAAARLGATLRKHRLAYAYTAPALAGMLVLVVFPFLYAVALAFTDFSLFTAQAPLADIWVGVKNFADILGDYHVFKKSAEGLAWNYQNIYWTLGITIIWTVSNVAYGVGMGLFLALMLNTKGLLGRPIYRVIFILPWAVPNYITALIWKGMFHQQFGVFNQIIQMLGGTPISWFENTWSSLFACIATNAWLSVPFMMVISLGALQSISADLYEAARVDGATRWQQFRSITLPSLKPALVPAVILSVIWTFNMFNIIYLVSAGEPAHSTEILITQAYKFAFEQYRYGYAAAYSMVIFAVLLMYGTWQNRVTKATEGI